jgi:hypothetical protein
MLVRLTFLYPRFYPRCLLRRKNFLVAAVISRTLSSLKITGGEEGVKDKGCSNDGMGFCSDLIY